MERILILGATSAIAEAVARIYASRSAKLYLVARNSNRLGLNARDLEIRGAGAIDSMVLDLRDYSRHAELLSAAQEHLDGIDVVLVAYGVLPDQAACEADAQAMRDVFETNALSVMSLLTEASKMLEAQGRGTLAVISSVAGDRGRRSNYVYGASKAALEAFLQGLRNRLYSKGVHVLTIKPGFVDTPMTAAFDKGPLWASPATVANGIVRSIDRRRDVVYLPWFWRLIMFGVRALPERLFKRLSL